MRRRNAGHIIRVVIRSLMGILAVLAVVLLAVAIYAGVTKTGITVGLGTFDVGIGLTDGPLIQREVHLGQPYSAQIANFSRTPTCIQSTTHKTEFWAVSLYVWTCDHWSNQPYSTPIPTLPSHVYP